LQLLQVGIDAEEGTGGSLGRLADVGTGSGILAIAAVKMGWRPVIAFDIDPAAVSCARGNVAANGVADRVRVWEAGVEEAEAGWFEKATVLANMTLEPVLELLRRLAPGAGSPVAPGTAPGAAGLDPPRRLVVAGILAGAQEEQVVAAAQRCGFVPGGRLYEAEWVSMELFPILPEAPAGVRGSSGTNESRKRV
jgi:ribosomal protein L11 methyltransferase